MEYTFRSNVGDEATAYLLDDFGLSYMKGNLRESIAYANILSILISRSDRVFRAYLFPANHRQIVIASHSYAADGTPTDQSKAYSLFIRVLHHHLKEKSKAEFKYGCKRESLWARAGISALVSFGLSLGAAYLGMKWVNPYLQSAVIALAVFGFIFVGYSSNLPKSYKPSDIPLRFLP